MNEKPYHSKYLRSSQKSLNQIKNFYQVIYDKLLTLENDDDGGGGGGENGGGGIQAPTLPLTKRILTNETLL